MGVVVTSIQMDDLGFMFDLDRKNIDEDELDSESTFEEGTNTSFLEYEREESSLFGDDELVDDEIDGGLHG